GIAKLSSICSPSRRMMELRGTSLQCGRRTLLSQQCNSISGMARLTSRQGHLRRWVLNAIGTYAADPAFGLNSYARIARYVHRDLVAYVEILCQSGQTISDPAKLIAPMLARYMATDRAFAKSRKLRQEGGG